MHDVLQGAAGFEQQALAVRNLIAAGPRFQDLLGLGHRDGLQLCGQRIFRELVAKYAFRGFRQPQPGMRFLRQAASARVASQIPPNSHMARIRRKAPEPYNREKADVGRENHFGLRASCDCGMIWLDEALRFIESGDELVEIQ